MKTVYLAGPVTGLDFSDATSWRRRTNVQFRERGIEAIDPTRGKDYLAGSGILSAKGYTQTMSTDQAITTRDRYDTQRADVVIANFLGAEKISAGTMIELGWADSVRTPVIVIAEEGNPHDHAMVRSIAGFWVGTLEEAIDVTCTILS